MRIHLTGLDRIKLVETVLYGCKIKFTLDDFEADVTCAGIAENSQGARATGAKSHAKCTDQYRTNAG